MQLNFKSFFISLSIGIILFSCGSQSPTFWGRKAPTVTSVEKYKPRYKDNGGKIPTMFFNQNKVLAESKYMVTLAALKKAREDAGRKPSKRDEPVSESSSVDSAQVVINQVSEQIQKEIDQLVLKLGELDPYDDSSHDKALQVMTELNDLYYKKINPYQKLRNKSINTIKSDFVFQTGKSDINNAGVTEIQRLVKKIEDEIIDWKAYVDDHNNKIFADDLYKITIQINGYADKQGNSKNNVKLSQERANKVRECFIKELKKLSSKYNVRYSVNFVGKGEELPPGVTESNKEDDPKRRISMIYSVVGPFSLLK